MKTMEDMMGLIIALIAVTGGLGIGAIVVKTSIVEDMKKQLAALEARNRERMALIERGLDPSIADRKSKVNSHGPLLWGLLFVGVALGALIGFFIAYVFGVRETIMVNAMALLFGGISLLVYYERKRKIDAEKAS